MIGFGPDAWNRLFPDRRPAQLRRFTEVEGQGGQAVSGTAFFAPPATGS